MSDQDNPYAAPTSAVAEEPAEAGGSIEATLADQSTLLVGDVLKEAWERVNGIKLLVLGAIALTIVAALVVSLPLAFAFGTSITASGGIVYELVSNVLTTAVTAPILAGTLYVGLRHTVGLPVQFDQLLSQFSLIVPIVIVSILQSLAVSVGLILLILPGIYLMVAFCLALPLVVEKGLAPIDALKTSMQLANKQFLNLFIIGVAVTVVVTLSAFTIVGLFWSVPWALMALTISYRQLAGISIAE